jgi:sialate O-acetylesterase
MFVSLCFAAIMVCVTAVVQADVRLPEIFDNNMVLQRDMPVPIWGWAEPEEKVTVSFSGQTAETTANANGKWSLTLKPLKTSTESATFTIKGKNEIKLTNVLVGDVWLCSGQSNMQWSMTQSDKAEYEEVLKNVDNLNLRLFHVNRVFHAEPQEKLSVTASWKSASAEAIPNFSAVALHFGRKLQAELGVPIGLINSAWGGTRIEPWTPPVGFQSVPALKNIAEALETKNPQSNQQQPTMLYNAMIHPMVPFALKGAIWYQGEANVEEGMLYAEKMKALIQGWRKVFNNPDLGFYYVQLAPYIYGNNSTRLPELWEAQSSVEKALPKTGQAVINDTVVNIRDIHPVHKKPVGERLALLALNRTYGKSEVVCASPEFDRMDIAGRVMTVHFKNAQKLQTRNDQVPDWFDLAGADGIFHKANAVIEGTTIKLTNSSVPNPVAVRYAWDQIAQPNVQNEAGLPLGAFRAGAIP